MLAVAFGIAPGADARPTRQGCTAGITSVSPDFGSTGTQVTIGGCDLVNVSEVDFGNTPATTFHVKSNTSITAVAPPGQDGQPVSVSAVNTTCASFVIQSTRATPSVLERRDARPANAHPCATYSSANLPSTASFSYVFGDLEMTGPYPHYYNQGEADVDWASGINHQEIWPVQPGPFAFTGTDSLVFHITTAFTDDSLEYPEAQTGFAQGSGQDSGQFENLGNEGSYGASVQVCTEGNGLDQEYGQCSNYDGNTGWWENVPNTYQSDSLTSPGNGGTVYGNITVQAPGVFLAQYYGGAATYRIAWTLQETDTHGNSGLDRTSSGYSPGFDVVINAPVAYAQMTVQPYSIIYEPPGDASTAAVSTGIGLGTDSKLGSSVTNSTSYTAQQNNSADFSASLAYVLGVSFDNKFNWDNKTVDSFGTTDDASDESSDKIAISTGTTTGPEDWLVPGDGATCVTPTDCSDADLVHPSPLTLWKEQPFWGDIFVLEIHPQYTVYQTPLGTRFVMQAATPTLATVRVQKLEDCRLRSSDPSLWPGGEDPCLIKYPDRETSVSDGGLVYSATKCHTPPQPTDACVELTPQNAADLLALDPFYVGGQGADVSTHRGIPMPSGGSYGVSGPWTCFPQSTTCIPPTSETPQLQKVSQSNTQAENQTTGTVQTAKIDYSDTLTTNIGGGFTVGGGVSGINAKEGLTLGTGETVTNDTAEQTTYSDSTATSTVQVSSVDGSLQDYDNTTPGTSGQQCKACHPVMPDQPGANVYLDRIFGSFMYQDPNAPPPPVITSNNMSTFRIDMAEGLLRQMIGQALSTTSFGDVPSNSPDREAIAFLTSAGDMSGYQGMFLPNTPITKSQLADALGNAVQVAPQRVLAMLDAGSGPPNQPATESILVSGLSKAMKLNPAGARSYLKPVLGDFAARKIVTRGNAARVLFAALQTRCLEGCSYNPVKLVTPPVPKIFSAALRPASATVPQGSSASATVQTRLVSGAKEGINLTASGLASVGVTATIEPGAVRGGQTARLGITTASSTPPGTYPIMITAKGATSTVTTTFELTVSAVKAATDFSQFQCSSSGPPDLSCNGTLTSGQGSPGAGPPPVPNALVTLTYTSPSGQSMIRTMHTDENGNFSDSLDNAAGTPLTEGNWTIQGSYAGDSTTQPATSAAQTVLVQSP